MSGQSRFVHSRDSDFESTVDGIDCVKPVSYTHLDVYKRQVVHAEVVDDVEEAIKTLKETGEYRILKKVVHIEWGTTARLWIPLGNVPGFSSPD